MTRPQDLTPRIMTHHRRPFVLCLLVLFTLNAWAGAVPIRFLAWDQAVAARKIGIQKGKDVTELKDLHPFKRTKPVDVSAGKGPLQLVALDRKGEDGKPLTVDIKAAPGLLMPLVLILPDANLPSGLRTFVVEDNTDKFPWGCIRFINATVQPLLVTFEKSLTPLAASWTPVDVAPGGQARNLGVEVAAQANPQELLYSAIWEHNPDVRKLVFIVRGADARTGAIDFKIIPENRHAREAESKPDAPPAKR